MAIKRKPKSTKLSLRLGGDMKGALQVHADRNNRTLTGEVLSRLSRSLATRNR